MGEDAGTLLEQWIAAAPDCRVLPVASGGAQRTILALDLDRSSLLAQLVRRAGGLIVESGWLRILGGGSHEMVDGLAAWNVPTPHHQPIEGALVVAHDAIGGFFAISFGALSPTGAGHIHYLAPDTMSWFDLGLSYGAWLKWMLTDPLEAFYERFRWPGWEVSIAQLTANQAVSIWPPLFVPGPSVADRSRRVVSLRTFWDTLSPLREQLATVEAA